MKSSIATFLNRFVIKPWRAAIDFVFQITAIVESEMSSTVQPILDEVAVIKQELAETRSAFLNKFAANDKIITDLKQQVADAIASGKPVDLTSVQSALNELETISSSLDETVRNWNPGSPAPAPVPVPDPTPAPSTDPIPTTTIPIPDGTLTAGTGDPAHADAPEATATDAPATDTAPATGENSGS